MRTPLFCTRWCGSIRSYSAIFCWGNVPIAFSAVSVAARTHMAKIHCGHSILCSAFGLPLPLPAPRSGCQQLVDLAAVHVDDLELPAVAGEALASLRNMLEQGESKARDGGIIAIGRQVQTKSVL